MYIDNNYYILGVDIGDTDEVRAVIDPDHEVDAYIKSRNWLIKNKKFLIKMVHTQ